MGNADRIKVAVAGVGNCAQALLHGMEYYRRHPEDVRGLMNADLGGYVVPDIEIVAAFDVTQEKVGKDLSEAVFAQPNKAYRYPGIDLRPAGVIVEQGPVLDGSPPHLSGYYHISERPACDVVGILKQSGAEMLVNLIPTGSNDAAGFYADAAIDGAKIGFINAMPTLIVCNADYQRRAIANGVPLIGDDVKSQLGGTAIHRALTTLMGQRGAHLTETYQINFAGNTDFANLQVRGASKHETKQGAVRSLMQYPIVMSTAFTFVELMGDRKTTLFYINGANFGNAPLRLEAKLEVEDSANLAGVLVDMIRYMRIALDRQVSGVLDSACGFLTKHPPVPMPDSKAFEQLGEFVAGSRER